MMNFEQLEKSASLTDDTIFSYVNQVRHAVSRGENVSDMVRPMLNTLDQAKSLTLARRMQLELQASVSGRAAPSHDITVSSLKRQELATDELITVLSEASNRMTRQQTDAIRARLLQYQCKYLPKQTLIGYNTSISERYTALQGVYRLLRECEENVTVICNPETSRPLKSLAEHGLCRADESIIAALQTQGTVGEEAWAVYQYISSRSQADTEDGAEVDSERTDFEQSVKMYRKILKSLTVTIRKYSGHMDPDRWRQKLSRMETIDPEFVRSARSVGAPTVKVGSRATSLPPELRSNGTTDE